MADFNDVYAGGELADGVFGPPWEIGEPQPALAAVVRSGAVRGSVLDVGCGTGEISLMLAAQGHPVTGVDSAPLAIEQARAKAAERGLSARYQVADALELPGFDGEFDTVIDSTLLHCLPVEERARYLATLHRVTRPGAVGHFLMFLANEITAELAIVHPLTEDEARALPSPLWTLESLDRAEVLSNRPPPGIEPQQHADGRTRLPAMLATLRRVD